MVKKAPYGSSEAVEASGDAILIADAIGHAGDGFHAIAWALQEIAKALSGDDYGDPVESDSYLDGTRK